jgi:hypothetical protein
MLYLHSVTKTNQLKLYREIIAVYSEVQTKPTKYTPWVIAHSSGTLKLVVYVLTVGHQRVYVR